MRKAMLVFLMLVPLSAWGEGSSKVDERKTAEEDICLTRLEYADADSLFYQATGGTGMYSPASPEGKYARDRDLKRRRLNQLEDQYVKRIGQPFKGMCRP